MALEKAQIQLKGKELIRAFSLQQPDIEGVLLPRLVDRLSATRAPVVIVLDDFHVIDEPACLHQVEFFLNHLPPTGQLVILTRVDPLLSIARHRVSGSLVEVRMRELRFSKREVDELVHRTSGFHLHGAAIDNLFERTEGWPAGVYLAALSLRNSSDPATFVRDFAGSDRYIVGYLGEEVITPQPADVRQFLTRTAILESFTASLCDAVVGISGTAGIIETLERSNLFLISLDNNRRWYRYHHLFRETLRDHLARTEPDIVSALHRRASLWYHNHGFVTDAIEHALAAGDVDGAIELIAGNWLLYLNAGRVATVRTWLRSVGDERVSLDPVAAMCAAWVAILSGDRQAGRRWLAAAETIGHEGPLPDGSGSLEFSAALLRGTFGLDGVRDMTEGAETAADIEIDPASPWYSAAKTMLGHSRYLTGDLRSAVGPLEEALQSDAAMPTIRILALSVLSLVSSELDRSTQASALAQSARRLVDEYGLAESAQVSLAYTAHGAALAREGRYPEARAELEHAVRTRSRTVGLSPWPTLTNIIILARVSLDLGDGQTVRSLLDQGREILATMPGESGRMGIQLDTIEQRLGASSRSPLPVEPLTQRELTVLGLLRGDLSLQQIANELYVTKNTIKTHTAAIYRKLGVSSRGEALERARELQLKLYPERKLRGAVDAALAAPPRTSVSRPASDRCSSGAS
jgi:LuxR family maltose regulon positive regulatory protein